MNKPKVSVLCITYNHAKFIRDCLDGFVMQKTNFPFEVLIHDDASTDGTADIIREYAEKYPDIIKPIFQTENQWSKGIYVDKEYNWPRINGEYVALCEGDDYWTDPYKLQKQVDFLESHPDYSVCFHSVRVTWDDGRAPDYIYPSKKFLKGRTTFKLSDLLNDNFIQTNSVMYRWRLECKDLFPDGILPCDWYLHMLHAQVGKIGFIPDIMGVYRRNAGGIWTNTNKSDNWFVKNTMPCLKCYKCASAQFNHDFTSSMIATASNGICAAIRTYNTDLINQIHDKYPKIWNDATRHLNNMDVENIRHKVSKYKKLFNIMLVVSIFVLIIFILKEIM